MPFHQAAMAACAGEAAAATRSSFESSDAIAPVFCVLLLPVFPARPGVGVDVGVGAGAWFTHKPSGVGSATATTGKRLQSLMLGQIPLLGLLLLGVHTGAMAASRPDGEKGAAKVGGHHAGKKKKGTRQRGGKEEEPLQVSSFVGDATIRILICNYGVLPKLTPAAHAHAHTRTHARRLLACRARTPQFNASQAHQLCTYA